MTNPGSCPRNGKGTVWVRGIDTWYLYYIGTYDGQLKTCKYTNPVPGGSFRFDNLSIEKFPFISEFISIKPITALIINALQDRMLKKPGFNVQITPQAVRAELLNIAETRQVIQCSHSGNGDELPLDLEKAPTQLMKKNPFLAFYTVYNRDHVKFTLVCHPVGLHLDTFADKMPSLENKVCFEIPKRRVPQTTLISNHPHGRGGGSSPSQFVFGLLDWSGGQRSRRRVWTDPANSHLDHAPSNSNDHLTRETWEAFFQSDCITIPQGVDRDKL
jgi:hypothetical protein